MELQQVIQSKIYEIRGYKVMLDFDLAEIYQVETKRLKEQVRRNIGRFPPDFMFELTKEEYNYLRSQIATLEVGRGKYSKYLPFAFSELGVAMLSSVLRSDIAIKMNINIMRAFVAIRQIILTSPGNEVKELQKEIKELKQYIEEVFTDYNDINDDTRIQLELINETLAELQAKDKAINKPRNPIGFIKPK
jgi:ORF6N domain.